MTLDLYINRSDNRKLFKNLVNVVDGLPCDFKYPTNEDHPDITLASTFGDSITEANYCRVRETGLYYEIDNRTYEYGNMITLHCTVDPFYTYRNQIGGLACLIERQEYIYQPYIIDNNVILDSRNIMESHVLGVVYEVGNHVIINTTGGVVRG